MAYLLGVDTGGTYTDAVVLDEAADQVIAKAKALTSRPDLAVGVGAAIDAAMAKAGIDPGDVTLVSLSTTLATNALVEGQGGRIALVVIGFDPADLARDGLQDALAGDPVIALAGGHDHAGQAACALDEATLRSALADLPGGITGFAVAARFATRNPAHERQAGAIIREVTGLPVTSSHELSSALGGPKRALTAVLNARLIGMIDRLISACEDHLTQIGIAARLMVVRGDGALVPAALAREKPIETILSGPAASLAGASWLTGLEDALVSDIGGTTTDVCLLQGGRPKIDPQGARVGPYRTMVEAVAMRTTGLGGDSAVAVETGLHGGLRLGPRRMMPVSLLARDHPMLVHNALDRALGQEAAPTEAGQFVVPLFTELPAGLDKREAAVAGRLVSGPLRMTKAVTTRIEAPALTRLVARGQVLVAGVTPSDAAHVLGLVDAWDASAAEKAMQLFARQRDGGGERIAKGAEQIAQAIIDQLTAQTVTCLMEAAFAEDHRDWDGQTIEALARHPLTKAGLLRGKGGVIDIAVALGVPVVGLGASAASFYQAVGACLGTDMHVPADADVANAIGAVVGQVAMQAKGSVTSPGAGRFVAHLPDGPADFADQVAALGALEAQLEAEAVAQADRAGVATPRISIDRDIRTAEIEGQPMFVSATICVTARGRPRIAVG